MPSLVSFGGAKRVMPDYGPSFFSCCHSHVTASAGFLCFLLPHLNMKPTCYAIIVCFAATSDLFFFFFLCLVYVCLPSMDVASHCSINRRRPQQRDWMLHTYG